MSRHAILIDPDLCVGCGLCVSICIRDSIRVENGKAVYDTSGDCFRCYQCFAVCPKAAIRIREDPDFAGEPVPKAPAVSYNDMMSLMERRRSVRWFTKEKVSREEFERLFEAARYSPTSMHRQDVEMVVVDERLDDFMEMVYEALKPIEAEYSRIHQFCMYQEGTWSSPKGHPFLWEGRQLILAFSHVATDAAIAMTRVELTAYTMGLGGFHSLFMNMAAERDPERFSRFFPEVGEGKRLQCVFVIGHPRVTFRRTLPPRKLTVRYERGLRRGTVRNAPQRRRKSTSGSLKIRRAHSLFCFLAFFPLASLGYIA